MESLRVIIYKALYPPTALVIAGIPITALLMVYVFAIDMYNKPVAYVSYAASAYFATVLVLWVIKRFKPAVGRLKAFVGKNRYAGRYMSDMAYKTVVNLHMSALMNILYALIKLAIGIYSLSVWHITLAAYYMFLISMKLMLLRRKDEDRHGSGLIYEYKKYRKCAVILLFMNFALIGMVILAIHENEGFEYPGTLIFAVAAYDFYIIISSIVNLAKSRRHGSPVISASRVIGFASALIAMLSLETAMLAQFGGENQEHFRNIMVAITGGVISAIFIITATYMIINSKRKIAGLNLSAADERRA